MLKTFCLLCTAAFAELKAGYKASIDVSVLTEAKDEYFEKLISVIDNLELPDWHGYNPHNYMMGNSFYIRNVEDVAKDVTFETDPSQNAFIFNDKKITAVFKTLAFSYEFAPLKVAKGHAEVDMLEIEIQIGESFSTQETQQGKVVPQINSVDTKCVISRNQLVFHLHGNFYTKVADDVERFFRT